VINPQILSQLSLEGERLAILPNLWFSYIVRWACRQAGNWMQEDGENYMMRNKSFLGKVTPMYLA
jgi:hypothetical protein